MTDRLRILLLEDNPADAELIARFLKKSGLSFDSRRVEREDTFARALAEFRPDAILADYSLPQFDGLQALNLVRLRDPNLPFIFVTGALGEEGAVELLCKGANDYVLKDVLTRLPMALERALETAHQRKALHAAEQSLRESEERFRAIVETTMDWIWEVDAEGRYTYVSPASTRLLGYAPEEMLGRRPIDFMPPDEAARIGANFFGIVAAQQPFSLLENTCLRKDGIPVEMETSGIPIVGADGRFLGYRGIDRDITQRKRHVATLLLQARRATALLELPRAAEHMDEREFMQFGQELAEELTASRIAFIHFVNEDQETIELVTWSRRTLDGYCQAAYDKHYPISQAGVWADALRQRAPTVFNEYSTTPRKHGLPEGHAELTRLISVPVMEGDLVRMMAGVGNKDSLYTDLDVESVQLIANEIWRIVRQRRADQELRKLSLAVEQSPASIVITDLDAHIEYANPAFTRVSGYRLDEAMGQNPRVLQSGQTTRNVYDDLWTTLGRGDVWRGEFSNRRKDGSDYVELAIISPVRQPDGRITHYLAVKEDITERKRVEEELKHYRLHLEELVETRTLELKTLEERSRLILESSADGLYGEDTEGRATFINPSACAMLGYRPEDVLGCCTHDLIHHSHPDGTHYPKEDCPIHRASGHKHVLRQDEDVFWHADGHSFPVSYSSHPMYRDDQLIGAVVSFFDISAQKQTEAAREAALAEAERLARLKSEFLANMSHEIRTPLNAVLGFAQIGVRQSDGRKARDFFKRIMDSGQLLLGIVNDILDFSKIEAGKLNIEQGLINLNDVIEHSLDQLRARARDKALDLQVEVAGDLPASCRCDGLRLTQILGNLLSNAIKFTSEGSVSLAVSRDRDSLLFRVSDTGIGMTEDQVRGLFQPFEQADGSITRRFGGTGLGLAISKRLVDMMGGEIGVRSRLGEGARFEMRIPLIEPAGSILAQQPVEVAPSPQTIPSQRLSGLVILVAEDNAVNRLVIEEMFKDEGCWLVQVENGLQAVERMRQDGANAFDLVLMDIQMPILDGYEAARQIHAFAPDLPIIGLTAHALPAERAQCLASGMVDHVAKPVDLDTLVATILNYAPIGSGTHRACEAADRGERFSGETVSVPGDGAADETMIDWPALTSRYLRRPEFLPKLLESVLTGNAANSAALRQAVNQGDLRHLAFLAHSLKGTAGNLCADGFRDLAARTESHARAERTAASLDAFRLAHALDKLLLEVTVRLDWVRVAARVPGATSPFDPAALAEAIERLEALLAVDDTAANSTFAQFQGLFLQAFGEQAHQLGQQIERFDYQTALDTLRAVKAVPPRPA
ncbi:PAS domain S-box protein [Thiocystis violascens]|uniref:histidine kinase n=1 Tax=Thiocystis violascens (strain ATCC 17096 / DSM 198 / 6111) TaxID=765911 RepID=I3YAT2_THIV6|nr:PAS domain S-box protein [Thiocystis violascens]AFL74100.1 PAS domain S-box [Thiocystis violascens DSM 198]